MWFKKKQEQAETELKDMTRNIHEARLAHEKEKVNQARKILDRMANSTPALDFSQMRVVSIERHFSEIVIDNLTYTAPITVVGYINHDKTGKEVKEWYIRCNDEHHEQLVKDFKEHLNNRTKD